MNKEDLDIDKIIKNEVNNNMNHTTFSLFKKIVNDYKDTYKCCDNPKFAGSKQYDICENCGKMKER